jgi:hypothetical protein
MWMMDESIKGHTMGDLFKESEKKCNQRRRVAALRDGIEGAGVILYPSGVTGSDVWTKGQLLHASGDLPSSVSEAVERINLSLESVSAKSVTQDDVHIHYMEAANQSFIQKYCMFLDATTLRNVASRGESGMAFMNSHRTGGMSVPSELPFGRTFSGRYEELEHEGVIHRRALLGVYMLKGHFPNGTQGPSTDALHRAIDAGTLSDVSIGLNGGQRICDVCARELGEKDCPHVPGTAKGLSPEQMEAQKARGVTGGKASYTIVDGQPYEVSAVFKGAVNGAGFRKALASKQFAMSDRSFGNEILSAYGSMMDDSDLRLLKGKPKMNLTDFARMIGLAQKAGIELEDLDDGTVQSGTMVPLSRPTQLQTATSPDAMELDARKAELDAREAELDELRFGVEADRFIAPLVAQGRVLGADVDALKLAYVQAALDDKRSPLSRKDESGAILTRVALVQAANRNRPRNSLLSNGDLLTDTPVIPDGQKVLPLNDSIKEGGDGPISPDRKKELLGMSDYGVAVLSTLPK